MKIVKLNDAEGNGIYPVGHSDAIKIKNQSQTLTAKLVEIDTKTNVSVSSSTGVTIGGISDPQLVIDKDTNNGLVYLRFTKGNDTYSAVIPSLRVDGNELQYSNDGQQWNTVLTFGKLSIKYVDSTDPLTGDLGDLALVGDSTNGYDLKVYNGTTWQPIGDISVPSLDAAQIVYDDTNTQFGDNTNTIQKAVEKLSTSDGIKMAGEDKTLTEKMGEIPDISSSDGDSDLAIADEEGSVLARFDGGHFKTKEFDSRDVSKIKQNTGLSTYDEFDEESAYALGDVVLYQGLLYKFTAAHVAGEWNSSEVEQTNIIKELDVEHPIDSVSIPDSDLDITDASGNVLARFQNGHIQVKKFNSAELNKATPMLKGKRVAFLGDSITFGYYATSTSKRYSSVFCNINNCVEINLGVAGTCIANNTTNGLSSSRFITRATSANLSNVDLIFVWGGTNDFSYDSKAVGEHFAIETITGGTYIGTNKKVPPTDTDTFSGALHELILQIRSVAPNAQLVFIQPMNRGRYNSGRPISSEDNIHGNFLQDFRDAISDICHFYAIPVVPMNEMINQDWTEDTSSSLQSYDYDGIHPNNAGHERIAKMLTKWVESNLII